MRGTFQHQSYHSECANTATLLPVKFKAVILDKHLGFFFFLRVFVHGSMRR